MKKIGVVIFQFVVISILFSSCAAGYHPVHPKMLMYHSHSNLYEVDFSYKYNVLIERGNNKYAKKERTKGVRLVAVRMTNNGDEPFIVHERIGFYANDQRLFPMEPMMLKSLIKQQSGFYLFYLLFAIISYNTLDEYGNVESSFPIGLIIGPGLAIGNMVGASTANTNLISEYSRENILNKTLEPGQTVTGLVAFNLYGYPELSIRYLEN